MVKIKNPISDWLKKSQSEQVKAEASAKIKIADYTDSLGETFAALVVCGIMVKRITPENVNDVVKQLEELRVEYYNKHTF